MKYKQFEREMDRPLLEGKTVRLAAMKQSDAEIMGKWSLDSGAQRFQDTNGQKPIHEDGNFDDWLGELNGSHDHIRFAIRRLDDDVPLGFLGFGEIEWTNQCCEVYVGIGDRSHWGMGYGREAMEIGLEYAFDEMNFHRIGITVLEYNSRAIKLYESLGFIKEGTFRDFGQRKGERYDMYLYSLLRPEWVKKKES